MSTDATAGLMLAIINHTALQFAGLSGEERRCALATRLSEVSGMLELARRLPASAGLAAALEAHRRRLRESRQNSHEPGI